MLFCVSADAAGEEYTLALAIKYLLGHVGRRGPVVKNLSSSRMTDEIAAAYGCSTFAAPVGEINVRFQLRILCG
jgi:phosphomannomutase